MHIPVLKDEVIKYLNPQPNENFIDCTFGFGGHSKAILEKNAPAGRVLGIECDSEVIKFSSTNFQFSKERLIVVNDSYANLEKVVEREKFGPVNGILLDLGMSSWDVEESGRGFSYNRNEKLDMRYGCKCQMPNDKCQITAEEIVNKWPQEEIERILREYGEERFAGRIAREIGEARKKQPIKTTFQLVEIIKGAIPGRFQRGLYPVKSAKGGISPKAKLFNRANPATRIFQALRITVNDELGNLERVLPQAVKTLAKGGRLVVISFHSLEDRLVKNFFKAEQEKNIIETLTKKPITASPIEIRENPKSRSAKLRSVLKL